MNHLEIANDLELTKIISDEIRSLILKKNYPCIAAVQSVKENNFIVGTFGQFGSGTHWQRLRSDLLSYLELLDKTKSNYLTYWAVFTAKNSGHDIESDNENEFEQKLWQEISFLTSKEDRTHDWDKSQTSDPGNPAFSLSLGGEKLFVVGLHPQSSRLARKFSRPALVFNAFSQFEKFKAEGTYESMVKTIRQRDLKFQGSINPMVLSHGETWESIQFSGRQNPDSWECPFQFMQLKDK